MRTRVSIPDDIFSRAEDFARRMKISRSELYSLALAEYLDRHLPERITEAMDRTIAEIEEPKDAFVSAAARQILMRTEW